MKLSVNQLRVTSYGYPECLRQVVAKSGWRKKRGKLPYGKGIGIAGSQDFLGGDVQGTFESRQDIGQRIKTAPRHQCRARLVVGIEGTPNHLLPLGDVHAELRFHGGPQLHVTQLGEHAQVRWYTTDHGASVGAHEQSRPSRRPEP